MIRRAASRRSDRTRGLVASAVAVVAMTAVGCANSTGDGTVAATAAHRGVADANGVAPKPAPRTVVASGEIEGVRWQLMLDSQLGDQVGELICLETRTEESPPASTCAVGELSGPGEAEPQLIGRPQLTRAEPTFVFGRITNDAVRVVAQLDSGAIADGTVVQDERAQTGYYLVPLPRTVAITQVIAFGRDGSELGRRPMDEPAPSCEEHQIDGGRGVVGSCSGSVSAGGEGSGVDNES